MLGCGPTALPLPKDIAEFLAVRGIKVEVLDSVRQRACAASRQFAEAGRLRN